MRSMITLLIFLSLLLTSCSPRINTSSKIKMESSIEKVRNSLPENKRGEFNVSLQMLIYSQIFNISEEGYPTTNSVLNIEKSINGKTGLEIITLAENLQKNWDKQEQEEKIKEQEQQRKKVMQEIKKLESQKVSVEKDKVELAKFKLVLSHFYQQKEKYSEEELIIKLTMKNETNHSISKGYFVGTLASPNRSVPWLQDSFNYSIPGGLEPGEEINLRLAPQYSSELNTMNISQDAVFTVEVKQLNGVNNKPLFSVCKFTQEDEKKLKNLKASLRHKSISESELYDYKMMYDADDCPEIKDDYNYGLKVDLLP